jgi:sugar-specific transcriptional regulator TrmB
VFVVTHGLGCGITGEETVKGVLRSLGLTEKEAAVYIFLSKRGVLKCSEIAKGMKRHTAQIYRILKILQTKGLLESTLEAPTRFTPVPFEIVLDLSIKTKRDEVALMEKTKQEILTYWKSIRQPELELSLEKFVVIEGNSKIYNKISQMIKETKKQLLAVTTVPILLRADQLGLFDTIFTHPLGSKIEFRFLTDLSERNLNAMKNFLKRMPKAEFKLKGRSPDIGLQLSPRMVIRDGEEALFFITPKTTASVTGQDEVGLWTDCKELVLAFVGIFEEMWRNALDIKKKITAVETGRSQEVHTIEDEEKASQKYTEMLRSADKEILLMTSSKGLIDLSQKIPLLNEAIRKGVSIRIMAPIIEENQDAAKRLAERSQLRHVAISDLGTTIIDRKHLFRFKGIPIDQDISKPLRLGDTQYSDDLEYVNKIKMTMEDIWAKSSAPSFITWEPSFGLITQKTPFSDLNYSNVKKTKERISLGEMTKDDISMDQTGNVPSIEFVQERWQHHSQTKEPITARGWMAHAIIRLPNPEISMIGIQVIHLDEKSAFGGGAFLVIHLWLETPSGQEFVPVALVLNRQGAMVMQPIYAGTPASGNIVLVEPHQLEVFRKGNTVFAGWTVDVPLPPLEDNLGPSCLFFEGYGSIQRKTRSYSFPSGYKSTVDSNESNAFVTFMTQAIPYIGTGNQGYLVTKYMTKTMLP